MKNNNQHQSSISDFVDSLIYPPILSNPLRKSNSEKKITDQPTRQINLFQTKQPFTLSPQKVKFKSEDKQNKIFSSYKNYIDPMSNQTSLIASRLTEFQQIPSLSYEKGVRFRQNLIMRNSKHKRENSSRQARTPSILKKSQEIRLASYQLINKTPHLNSSEKNIHTNHTQKNLYSTIGDKVPQNQNFMFEDKEGRATKTNEVVYKRYQTILERFAGKYSHRIKKQIKVRSDQKYKDELFPPIKSSVYRGGNIKLQQPNQFLKWTRLSDLFKRKKIVVVSQGDSNIQITCNSFFTQNAFLQNSFNCIKNCKIVLEKMFEHRQQNDYGVYVVKIFQENVWKYVIIDDYIPTIRNEDGDVIPAFISIHQIYEREEIQIWPFLLEKAYANYYANYQSLHYGNTLDFVEQITGTAAQMFQYTLQTKKLIAHKKTLSHLFQQENIVYLGYRQSQNLYMPIVKNKQKKPFVYIFDGQMELTMENIFEEIDKIYVFDCSLCDHTNVSTIGMNIRRNNVQVPRLDISLRLLKITEKGMVSIGIRQKEKRFYQKSNLNYNYIWVRVLLLQKEFNGDCRWIDGKYSNSKSINILRNLDIGQYYIIVLPQWKTSHCYELSVIVNSSTNVSLSRKEYDQKESLINKGCTDLAQRYGKLNQINLFACSYSYINEEVGLLIENINNQRYNGQVRINRSISGLKAAVELIPFNIQFYQNKNPKLPYKTQISLTIASDHYYTVILMMRGGIDPQFLKRFDFGK